MYETNFGFKDRPFTVSPSPACFYPAAEHQNVLDELLVSISSFNGITILTGEAGTGKTALCRQVITRLEEQFQIQFVEHCNFPTVRALLQTLLYNLTDSYEKVSEQELRLALSAEIRSSYLAHSQPLLLIVDEAHLLPTPFLEELRVLSDIAFDGKPALQLMLSGQPALEETLIQPAMSSLNQRVGCQVYLDRMTRQESKEYIDYRIQRVATEEREYFSPDAIQFITHVSDGLPRCLNQICDHSLMLAYLQDAAVVNEDITREAFTDLQQLPLHWNDPLPVRSPLDEIRGSEQAETDEWETAGDEEAYQINVSIEEQLNELADLSSNVSELAESAEEAHFDEDELEWDSSDLLSLGEEIEAIEVGGDVDEPLAQTDALPSAESETIEIPASEIQAEEILDEVYQATDIQATEERVSELTQPALSVEASLEELFEELEQRVPETTPEPAPAPTLATTPTPVSSVEISDEFVPIVDRYAAIDAGLDPTGMPEEAVQSNVMSSPLRLQPPQFRTAEPPQVQAAVQPAAPAPAPAEPVAEIDGAALGFEEEQLKRLQPGVFQELAKEISQDDGTFETMLAEQVYEVCSETRRGLLNALNEIRNYTEAAEEQSRIEEEITYDMVEPEVALTPEPVGGTSFRLDVQPPQQEQSSATAHLKGPAFSRYKNLFTRLRRKQDAS